VAKEENMENNGYTIVVGIDFSDVSSGALEQAIELGSRRPDAEIHVLYVDNHVDDRFRIGTGGNASDSVGALERVESSAIQSIDKMEKKLGGPCPLRRLVSHFRVGLPADQIVQLAVDLDADLVVVGTHGRKGVARLVLGSTAERVLRLSRCPVFVVRPKDHEDAGAVPEIEPPCPQCVAKRAQTGGAQLWCARHSEHHVRPHKYSYNGGSALYNRETSAMGSATPA
jgi:nucleotide-binding universal stress UspA family protein